jgi:hypothetical protein
MVQTKPSLNRDSAKSKIALHLDEKIASERKDVLLLETSVRRNPFVGTPILLSDHAQGSGHRFWPEKKSKTEQK